MLFCCNQKDAAKSADTERSKFVEQQRQFEQKKRELLEKEIQLRAQQDELEMRIGQAKDQKVKKWDFKYKQKPKNRFHTL